MNPKQIPQEQVPAPLQSFLDENGQPRRPNGWGWFGWEGWCVDVAIDLDAPEAIKWCHEQGFINKDTSTTMGTKLRRLCESRKHQALDESPRAPLCARVLEGLGYPA